MVAGNVGTGGRVTYTIVGDAVNQAARLQVMTRDLASSILITASTQVALGPESGFALRPFGAVPSRASPSRSRSSPSGDSRRRQLMAAHSLRVGGVRMQVMLSVTPLAR